MVRLNFSFALSYARTLSLAHSVIHCMAARKRVDDLLPQTCHVVPLSSEEGFLMEFSLTYI